MCVWGDRQKPLFYNPFPSEGGFPLQAFSPLISLLLYQYMLETTNQTGDYPSVGYHVDGYATRHIIMTGDHH